MKNKPKWNIKKTTHIVYLLITKYQCVGTILINLKLHYLWYMRPIGSQGHWRHPHHYQQQHIYPWIDKNNTMDLLRVLFKW